MLLINIFDEPILLNDPHFIFFIRTIQLILLNLRIRVYRGDINTPVTDPRLYNVEGEFQWGLTGYGPALATITGAIEYRPTHIYLYVPTGCTFIAKYYVTNYK